MSQCGDLPTEPSKMDFVMLAIALVFFAISLGYVYACDNL
jgi:hypothetical protein